jgi:hypothetical protein
MDYDLNSQLILAQLDHFYKSFPADKDPLSIKTSHFTLDLVYDHLKTENSLPEYSEDIKKLFWELSLKTALQFN